MRLGYVVSSPELVKSVFTVKNSFNHFPVDFLAQKAGIASCRAAYYYAKNAKAVLSVEMNMGQMVEDVKLALDCRIPVSFFGRTGGIVPSPNEVLNELRKLNGGAQ